MKKLIVIVTSVIVVISFGVSIALGYTLITDKRWDKEHDKFLKILDVWGDAKHEAEVKEEELDKLKEENKEKAEILESWKSQTQKVRES